MRTAKKSASLEIRLPYATKMAFMEKAKQNKTQASELVRKMIDMYLSLTPEPKK